MGKLFWFLLGAATGAAGMALLWRVQEEQETEDFEEVAQSLQDRLDSLEGQFGTSQ